MGLANKKSPPKLGDVDFVPPRRMPIGLGPPSLQNILLDK